MAETTKNSRVTYSPVRMTPLDRNRCSTDRFCIIPLVTIFTIWLTVSCLLIAFGRGTASKYPATVYFANDRDNHERQLNVTEKHNIYFVLFDKLVDNVESYVSLLFDQWGIPVIVLCIFVGTLVFSVCVLLLGLLPKFWTWFAIIVMATVAILGVGSLILTISFNAMYSTSFTQIFKTTVYTSLMLLCLTSIVHAGAKTVSQYIRKSCGAIFVFPSAFLFGILLLLIDLLVIALTIAALRYQYEVTAYSYIVKLGSVYLRSFTYYVGAMVFSQIIATHHGVGNGEDIPKRTVLHSIGTVFRYHLGTAAFAATGILPFLVSFYVLCKHSRHFAKGFWLSVIEIIWKIVLLFTMSDYALVITATHSLNFVQATKKVYHLTSRKSTLVVAVVHILAFLLGIGYFIALLAFTMVPFLILSTSQNINYIQVIEILVLAPGTVLLLLLPILIVAVTSVNTTLLHYLEADEDNEDLEKPSHIPLSRIE